MQMLRMSTRPRAPRVVAADAAFHGETTLLSFFLGISYRAAEPKRKYFLIFF